MHNRHDATYPFSTTYYTKNLILGALSDAAEAGIIFVKEIVLVVSAALANFSHFFRFLNQSKSTPRTWWKEL